MKILFLIGTLSFTFCGLAQTPTEQEINQLKITANRLEIEIKSKSDSLKFINMRIVELNMEKSVSGFKDGDGQLAMKVQLMMPAELKREPIPWSSNVARLPKGDTVILTDYTQGYWSAITSKGFGFLPILYFDDNNPEMEMFKEMIFKRTEEQLRLEREEDLRRAQADFKKYQEKVYKQYGKELGDKLIKHQYWIGMSQELALVSLGKPRSINKSVGSWGVHEQWVYYSLYLYFENGILSSFQSRN